VLGKKRGVPPKRDRFCPSFLQRELGDIGDEKYRGKRSRALREPNFPGSEKVPNPLEMFDVGVQ